MLTMTFAYLLGLLAIAFLLGACVGGFIMYTWSENELKVLHEQNDLLEEKSKHLSNELEDCKKSHAMLDLIEDVPEYLRDKYDIPGQKHIERFADDDEDYDEIYV